MPIAKHLDHFRDQRVLVIGDVILDHYVRGSVSRTSPEAPVPILAVQGEEWLPGGAANVAKNITALGARAELVGVVGDDDAYRRLREIFHRDAWLKPHLLVESKRITTLKTRCVAQGQQMLRFDHENTRPISEKTRADAIRRVGKLLGQCTGVILSDYGKGFLQPELIGEIIREARDRGLKVLVDPKGRDYRRYAGATVLTPNQKEAAEASGIAIEDVDSLAAAAKVLQKTVKGDAIVITRGAAGVSAFPKRGGPSHLPARAREVFDVTGAGDTMIATLGLALFAGAKLDEAAQLGNLAAGIVVGRAGVASVSVDSLRVVCQEGDEESGRRKLVTAAELEQICRSLHQNDRKIVFTNGFFDLLHHGHVRLLSEARKMGDCLIVAINSDASTRRLKGKPRPILKENERVDLLASLPSVDYLTIFEGNTPEELLRRINPDILVKGGVGASKQHVIGSDYVEGYGGEVRLVNFKDEPRISTILDRAAEKE